MVPPVPPFHRLPTPVSYPPPPTTLFLFLFLVSIFLVFLLLAGVNQSFLIPPPLTLPRSRPPLRLHEEVYNMLRWNVLRDHILAPGDVGLHIIESDHPHRSPKREILPGTFIPQPGLFSQDPLGQLMLEISKPPLYYWVNDPSLCTAYQDGLHYGKVKTLQHLSVLALPPQYHQQYVPYIPRVLKVVEGGRPVISCLYEEEP